MAVYAVFEPPLKEDAASAAAAMERALRVKFVRDGFSWVAFLFGPVWMLYHRLWLAVVCYVALIFIIAVIAFKFGLAEGAVTLASTLIAVLIGFEAATLRRRKLLRWRWRDLGVVVEKNRETAERRFFDRWVATVPGEPMAVQTVKADDVVPVGDNTVVPPGSNP
jgi:hypothetical protein